MKALFGHVLGWILIALGVSAILGDVLGIGPFGWRFGAVFVALGAWLWIRALLQRRAVAR
jgi:hypothetical protein